MAPPTTSRRLPPGAVVLAAAAVVALRGLPALALHLLPAPAGQVQLPLPYVPKDWLVYMAFLVAPPDPASTFLSNPYTTEPQDGRFILLLHEVLRLAHAVTGLPGDVLLEAARVPLLLGFTCALWWFLGMLLQDERERRWAAVLVLLSGGLHPVVVALARAASGPVAKLAILDLRQVNGWSTFESAFNPVWLAGLSLFLVVVGLALRRDHAGPRAGATLALALVALWCTHAYSAVAALGVIGGAVAAEVLLGEAPVTGRRTRLAWLAAGTAAVAAVALWQRGDPTFHATSGAFFGKQGLTPAWYPLTLGALLPLAILGLRAWARRGHPWRLALGGWLAAISLLHASNLVNGYHFVPYLHLPVAILAAPAVVHALDRWRAAGARLRPALLLIALVVGAPLATWDALRTREDSQLDAGLVAVARRLGELPPGRVLAPLELGQLVPALSRHRTFVGHWFMTPAAEARRALVDRLLGDPAANAAGLRRLASEARIDYVALPQARADAAAAALGDAVAARGQEGAWAILLLRPTAAAP